MSLVHYLREWRVFKGWTQEELADKAGTYKSIISRIETGKHSIDVQLLLRLVAALEITPTQFFAPPGRESIDYILRNDTDEQVKLIAEGFRSGRAARLG